MNLNGIGARGDAQKADPSLKPGSQKVAKGATGETKAVNQGGLEPSGLLGQLRGLIDRSNTQIEDRTEAIERARNLVETGEIDDASFIAKAAEGFLSSEATQ